jgi:hypothetical protein
VTVSGFIVGSAVIALIATSITQWWRAR